MLRLAATAEKALWGLIRAAIAAGGWQQRVGEALVDELRPPEKPEQSSRQMALWTVGEDGQFELPWRIAPEFRFRCAALRCPVRACECVTRQDSADSRTHDTWRGQQYRTCTRSCTQGQAIRAALGPALGPQSTKKRRHARQAAWDDYMPPEQRAARVRLAAAGMLEPVSTVDGCGVPVRDQGKG